MIAEYRKKHIFAVAELMQKYGEERGYTKSQCNELYTLGLLHDIGYAFLEEKDYEKHEVVGGLFLKEQGYKFWQEVYYHGVANSPYQSEYLDLLNLADMHIDYTGEYVSFDERLQDISRRYNTKIEELNSFKVVQELKAKGYK